MIFREFISTERQLSWYRSLNPANDIYMVIEYDGKPRGMINVKNINYQNDESESGLFFWDHDVLQSPVPVLTSWLGAESGYLLLGGQFNTIHVLKENKTALDFNIKMGFCITDENENAYILRQSKKSFSEATLAERNKYLQLTGGNRQLMLSFGDHEQDDFRQTNLANYLKIITVLPEKQQGRTFWFDVDF